MARPTPGSAPRLRDQPAAHASWSDDDTIPGRRADRLGAGPADYHRGPGMDEAGQVRDLDLLVLVHLALDAELCPGPPTTGQRGFQRHPDRFYGRDGHRHHTSPA